MTLLAKWAGGLQDLLQFTVGIFPRIYFFLLHKFSCTFFSFWEMLAQLDLIENS